MCSLSMVECECVWVVRREDGCCRLVGGGGGALRRVSEGGAPTPATTKTSLNTLHSLFWHLYLTVHRFNTIPPLLSLEPGADKHLKHVQRVSGDISDCLRRV